MTMSGDRHQPLFDVHPVTGASIEVFYADQTLETFGRRGGGWFWHFRSRRFAPEGAAHGPFPSRYAAYRHAFVAISSSAKSSQSCHDAAHFELFEK